MASLTPTSALILVKGSYCGVGDSMGVVGFSIMSS